ncbi:RadC family protein [Portibacter lacus]|uniref:DNA repair protein RadC n=1 Tax=Portibacter lacus TaxID=1099794 RepID=A0AA37SR39_9BACT|nr:DNA repair protein RadC [Portibacter lacus]GLR19133.1 DNA repair protein RadC [Portibacter lacus]
MNIKEWAVEDRPREKLYRRGAKDLTDAELLAIIISSGTRSISALQLAKNILSESKNNLNLLAEKDIKTLCKIKGIGPAKAISIKAVMEMANRKAAHVTKRRKITCSKDSYNELELHFRDLNVEEFWILFLNRGNIVIGKQRISIGGVTGTIVDPKVIYKKALDFLATGIILAHNHPSGNLVPSNADLQITRKIVDAGKSLDISVYDHLIIAGNSYYSFADEGKI